MEITQSYFPFVVVCVATKVELLLMPLHITLASVPLKLEVEQMVPHSPL